MSQIVLLKIHRFPTYFHQPGAIPGYFMLKTTAKNRSKAIIFMNMTEHAMGIIKIAVGAVQDEKVGEKCLELLAKGTI